MLALLAATGLPTTIGVAEGIKAQKRENVEKKRTAYCSLSVFCSAKSSKRKQVHGKGIVLRDGKLFVSSEPPTTASTSKTGPEGYPFNGFYITFPNDKLNPKPLGMVSLSSSDPPGMGFIYADRNTFEVRYGNRSTSLPHIVGPWDWTEDEVGVTLESKEAFVVLEEEKNQWAVYYDRDEDWEKLPKGRRVLEISLERVLREVATEETAGAK